MDKERYLGNSELKGSPNKPLKFRIKDDSIKFSHLSEDALQGIKEWLNGRINLSVFDYTFDYTFK